MPKKPPVHVTPHAKGGWAVIREGSSRSSSTHATQAEAAAAGKAAAKRDRTEFVLHGKDGKIRLKNTYGADPNPPKG